MFRCSFCVERQRRRRLEQTSFLHPHPLINPLLSPCPVLVLQGCVINRQLATYVRPATIENPRPHTPLSPIHFRFLADRGHQASHSARRSAKYAGSGMGGGGPVPPKSRLHRGRLRGAVEVRRRGGAEEQKQVLRRHGLFQGRRIRGIVAMVTVMMMFIVLAPSQTLGRGRGHKPDTRNVPGGEPHRIVYVGCGAKKSAFRP